MYQCPAAAPLPHPRRECYNSRHVTLNNAPAREPPTTVGSRTRKFVLSRPQLSAHISESIQEGALHAALCRFVTRLVLLSQSPSHPPLPALPLPPPPLLLIFSAAPHPAPLVIPFRSVALISLLLFLSDHQVVVVVAEGGGVMSARRAAATYDARMCIMISLLCSRVPAATMLSAMPREKPAPRRKKKQKKTRQESVQPTHTHTRSR